MSKLFLALFLALTPTAFGSIWYVDGVNGNDGNDCKTRQTACKTIGHAISLASSGDTIGVGPATYTENLTIGISLKVIGSGASTTIIDGGGVGTVVQVSATAVVLSKFTIRNGFAEIGGGILNSGGLTINDNTISGNRAFANASNICPTGGGISSKIGTLTINNSTIINNSAYQEDGLSGCPASGGGIYAGLTTPVTVSNSTISGNEALGPEGRGGGIFGGSATLTNTTISGNSSITGGGVYVYSTGVTVSSSTVSENTADAGGVGGIAGKATLQNTIVAGNSQGNCGGTLNSNGYNLSSDNTCDFHGPGDLNNTDPRLGTLGNYGGPTQTIPLLAGSPAIDAGNPSGCTDGHGHLLKTDQRGKPRPDKEDSSGCDMGAYERQSD